MFANTTIGIKSISLIYNRSWFLVFPVRTSVVDAPTGLEQEMFRLKEV